MTVPMVTNVIAKAHLIILKRFNICLACKPIVYTHVPLWGDSFQIAKFEFKIKFKKRLPPNKLKEARIFNELDANFN